MKNNNKKNNEKSSIHKNHKGPKKHLFSWVGPMKWQFGKTKKANKSDGILSKYYDYEAWAMACQSLGKKDTSRGEFSKFFKLDITDKDKYFEALKTKGK